MHPAWFPAVLLVAVAVGLAAARLLPPGRGLPPAAGRAVVGLAVLLYAAWFWRLAVRGVDALLFGYDLAHVMNVLWNTREGRFLHSSFLDAPILGHHLYLWLAALAPLGPSPLALQGLQIVALAAAAFPLHALGRRAGGEGLGLAIALAYLLHVGTHGQTQSAFDPASLGTPFLACGLWADAAGRPWLALAALAGALPAKEHFAGPLLVWGLLRLRRSPAPAGIAVAVALGWAGLYLVCVRAFGVGQTQAAIRFTWMDDGAIGAAAGAVAEATRPPKIGYLLHLLAPFGFLPLLGVSSLLAAPEAALVLVSTFPMHKLLSHYSAATIAPLAAGAAAGAARLAARAAPQRRPAWRRGLAAFVLASALGHAYLSGLLPGGRIWLDSSDDGGAWARNAAAVRSLLATIPPEASIGFTTEQPMLLLSDRPDLFYPLPYAPRAPRRPVDVWLTPAGAAPPEDGFERAAEGGGVAIWRKR